MCWFGGFIRFLSSRTTEQKKVHSDADTRPFAYSRELSYTSIKLGAYAPVRDAMEPLNEYIGLVPHIASILSLRTCSYVGLLQASYVVVRHARKKQRRISVLKFYILVGISTCLRAPNLAVNDCL